MGEGGGEGSIFFGVVMFVSLGLRLPLAESGPCALFLGLRVVAHCGLREECSLGRNNY
jgi:hypothetical protein